jgi:hypothetical protein
MSREGFTGVERALEFDRRWLDRTKAGARLRPQTRDSHKVYYGILLHEVAEARWLGGPVYEFAKIRYFNEIEQVSSQTRQEHWMLILSKAGSTVGGNWARKEA